MKLLHIGVDPKNLNKVQRTLFPFTGIIDGDGWNVWGEDIGTDENDDRTLHVMVKVENAGQARDLLIPILGRLTDLGTSKIIGVVSEIDDWSEQSYVWTAADLLAGEPR